MRLSRLNIERKSGACRSWSYRCGNSHFVLRPPIVGKPSITRAAAQGGNTAIRTASIERAPPGSPTRVRTSTRRKWAPSVRERKAWTSQRRKRSTSASPRPPPRLKASTARSAGAPWNNIDFSFLNVGSWRDARAGAGFAARPARRDTLGSTPERLALSHAACRKSATARLATAGERPESP